MIKVTLKVCFKKQTVNQKEGGMAARAPKEENSNTIATIPA